VIDYQQNQNWRRVVSSLQRISCVWLVVATWKMCNICSYCAQCAPPFGRWCKLGSVLMVWTFRLLRITLFTLFITQESKKRGDIFYISHGLCALRSCRMKEIIDCFKNQECTSFQLLEKVKYYSLWWLKARQITFVFGTQL